MPNKLNSAHLSRLAGQGWQRLVANWDHTEGSRALFLLNGDVEVEIFGICKESILSEGVPTVEIGTSGGNSGLIAEIVDATDLEADMIWHDATPTTSLESLNTVTERRFVVAGGQDIGIAVNGGAMTAGQIDFYLSWRPLSVGATVAVDIP
jgi:hypothetical protein